METDSGLDSPPYQLRLLGTPRIEGPEGVLTGSIAQRHRIALLALLATAPRGGLARDRLLGLLWPEAPTESARNLLNAAVHAVRRSLGEDVLISQGNGICLDASRVSIDVLEFEAALKAGKPGHAVDLYSGPFLDGLALPGAVEFEHWQEVERDRLERLFHTALERQAETIARAHGPVEAVTWWRRRLACTPTDARVVIRLMEALAASGDRAGALQAASVHAALMETEFGTSPDPDVLSLTEQLRAAPVIPRRSEPATPPAAEPASGALPAQPRSPRPRLTFAASAIVLLVTVGALLTALLDRAPILEPDRVIVAVFENQTGDPSLEPLGRIAADWITDGLQRSGMKVVPSLNALRAWRYVQGELGAARADDPVRALAEETGSALVVSGSYYRDRVGLHFRGQVSDAMADRLMISPVLVSTSADTMAAIDLLAQRITGGLALALELGPRLGTNASAMQPPKYAAFLEVVQGWDRFISTDFEGALVHLHRAAALDSAYMQPLLIAGVAHGNLGQFEQADSVARIVAVRRDRLSPHQRLRLEHVEVYVRRDWAAMVQVNEKLSRIAPQSDASYIVGYASVALNRPRQALEWLNRIDPQSAAFQGWFPYWEAVTAAHHLLGQHRTELKAAREARSQYPDRPDVLSMEVRALVARGQVDGLNDLIAKHFATRPQTDPSSRLRLYVSTLKELQAHGYGSHAHELAEHALRQHQPMSGDTIPAEERAAYAQLLYANQKWQEARRLFLRLALDDPTNLDYQGYVGTTAAHLGDRGEALRVSQQLASLDRPYLGGSNMLWCARIAAVLRDRTAAVRFLRLAFQAGAAFGIWVHQDLDFDPLRQDPEFLELIRPKN